MMIAKMIKDMFEEAEYYKKYMHMADEAEKEECKQKLKHIAEQERDHFKLLYDMVFAVEPTTAMEKAFKHHAEHIYKEMLEDK